ncbi:MAG: hypothetical protein II240_02455, partial [Bacteroidaceae bacterium]|nr:hypothetical protein [Bacteroidaceae bacterium]
MTIKTIQRQTISLTSAIMTVCILLASCSTTSNLPEGDILYTGIKSTNIEGKKGTIAEDIALTEVEAALAYAPNNAF